MSMLEIRSPQPDEMVAVYTLWREELYGRLGILIACLDFDREDAEPESAIHVVAFDAKEPISAIKIEDNAHYGPYIAHMVTRNDRRGEGIGSQVLTAAEARAREAGVKKLSLHSSAEARAFYTRHGFQPNGRVALGARGDEMIILSGLDKHI